jgi:predicted DNA-binding transcriptional regulator AlpA
MQARRILRTPEAATYCGVSPSTLEKRRLTGNGPRFIRLGGRSVGYTLDDLNRWIDAQRDETAASLESDDHMTPTARS